MPTLTLTVSYDGADKEILGALSKMVSSFGGATKGNGVAPQSSAPVEKFAEKFAGYVSRVNSQKNVMTTWLKKDGKAPLADLVKASGVRHQRNYGGVGSSLTRNMKRSGGPKVWYDARQETNGERIYEIADELVGPLKRAFKIA